MRPNRLISRTLAALVALAAPYAAPGAERPGDDAALGDLQVKVQKAGPSARAEDLGALAAAFERAGRPAEAAGALARAVAAGFAAPGVNDRLGRLWEAAGQFDKAALAYKAAAGEAGLAPDEAAARALHGAQVVDVYLRDGLRANKEYLALAKQWPKAPAAKQALLAVWNGGDRDNDEVRRQRAQAQELLLRAYPDDPALIAHLADFLARARGNPRVALEVYDIVVKAQPKAAENADVAGNVGFVLRGAGQPDAANARLEEAFAKSGDPRWLWEGGHSAQGAQRARLFMLFAERAPWRGESGDALWLAVDAGLTAADVERIAPTLIKQWANDPQRLVRVQGARARVATDPAQRLARWKEAIATDPWPVFDNISQVAVTDAGLREALAASFAELDAKGDPAAMPVGEALVFGTERCAGEDAAQLDRARDLCVRALTRYGLGNDDHARWSLDRLSEITRHARFDAAATEQAFSAVLAAPLSPEARAHAGMRAAETLAAKQAADRGEALRAQANAKPADPVLARVAEACSGGAGERAARMWELTKDQAAQAALGPAHQATLRTSARYWAERCELRGRLPEMTRGFYDATKDPMWAGEYVAWTDNVDARDRYDDALALAREMLAGPAKTDTTMAWHASSLLARQNKPKAGAELMRATWNRPFEAWSRDELWQYLSLVGRGGDRAGYTDALHALMGLGDWDRIWRGVLWEHGIPEDWKWALNDEVIKACPRRDIQAECLTRLAEAQRAGDNAGFLKTAQRVRSDFADQAHQVERVLLAMLLSAQERKDDDAEKATAQELYAYLQAHGRQVDENQFAERVRRVIEPRLAAWDKQDAAKAAEKKTQWFRFLVDHGGTSPHATWAARGLYDLERARDPVAGGLALHRLVRTGARERPDDFDRVLAEVTREMDAGRYGLAAGAFAHMALWFDPGRVGAERMATANRLAANCLGKLGLAQEIDDRDPLAPLKRANALIAIGDEAEAYRQASANLKLLEDNLASVPSDLVLLVARDQIREEKTDVAKRILGAYQRVLGDTPATADAAARSRVLLGEALFHEAAYPNALAEFQAVAARWPNTPPAIDAALRAGDCLYAQRQAAQARQAYEQLLYHDDRQVRIKAKFRLAVLASSEGQKDEAFRMFRELAADNPPKDLANQLYLDWGKLLIGSSRLKEAEDVLTLVGLSTNREPVAPGEPLRITLQDTYLQASQNRTSVPVVVTSSNGDREELELTLSQDIKGFFTGSIATTLGKAQPGDRVLEIVGGATIAYDYAPEFKLGRAGLTIGAGDIAVAANADLKASSAAADVVFAGDADGDAERKDRGIEAFLATYDPQAIQRGREIAGSASRTFRDRSQIKPGNPFYIAVRDADQDVSDAADEVVAQVRTAADHVQARLTETGPHTGVFAATVKTGLKPADIAASDTAPGRDALTLLTQPDAPGFDDADRAWIAIGDQQPGKAVTIDLKGLTTVDRLAWSRGKRAAGAAAAAAAEKPPEPVPGLFVTFFEGIDFTGRRLRGGIDVPSFDSYEVPDYGRENFCDRWSGEIQVPEGGAWTFGLIGDDGIRLTIAGKRLVDAWIGQGATLYASDLPLEPGWYPIQIEHYNAGGPSHLELVMAKAGEKPVPVPRDRLRAKGAGSSGGAGNAFGVDRRPTQYRIEISADGRTWTPVYDASARAISPMSGRFVVGATPTRRPIRTTRDAVGALTTLRLGAPVANGHEAKSAKLDLSAAKPDAARDKKADKLDWFGNGVVLIPKPGTYEFAVKCAGRAWLMVGDQLVVEKDRDEPAEDGEPRWRGRVEDLPFGHARLRLLANSDGALADAQLLWKPPGADAFTPIPAAALADAKDADIAALTGQGVATATWAEDRYAADVRFPSVATRFVRMVIDGWEDGDAPALASVRLWHGDELVMPMRGVDYQALAANDVLELSAGDAVAIEYLDEKNKKGRPEIARARLSATWYNGTLRFLDARNRVVDGKLREELFERYRFAAGDRVTVQVVDYDLDVSDQPDSVDVVFASAAGSVTVKAVETKPASGVFQAEIHTAAAGAPAAHDATLIVAPGEQITASYLDADNTVPGAPTKRVATLRETGDGRGALAIAPSRARMGERGEVQVSYEEPTADAAVALAPLVLIVVDPSAMVSSASQARVRLTTAGGASVDVALPPDQGRAAEGVFSGTVPLLLGDAQQPTWRLPAPGDAPASALLVGVAEAPRGAQPVLPVQGGEAITAVYLPRLGAKPTPDEVAAAVAKADAKATAHIATVGELAALSADFQQAVTSLHVGGELHVQVRDADADTTAGRDVVHVAISAASGDRLDLELEETEAHSGVFTATAPVVHAAAPDPADAQVQATFGDEVSLAYLEDGKPAATLKLPVAKGADADLAAFAKRFGEDALAARTQARLAECFFELYKSHREEATKLKEQKGKEEARKRLEALIADELAQGTQLLTRTIRDYGGAQEQDQLLYLLGNFEQESESYLEAIDRYQHLLAAYPDSIRAPEAQYKIAQCFESLKRFDEAWEAYVRLAYRWPNHELVGDAMVRIGLYYRNRAKATQDAARTAWAKSDHAGADMPLPKEVLDDLQQAAAVYGKFVERFPDHALVEKIALAQGDCFFQARDFLRAKPAFDLVARKWPGSAAKGLYWAGCACLEANQVKDCFLRFQNLLQNYPETTEAKYARGKLQADDRLERLKQQMARE